MLNHTDKVLELKGRVYWQDLVKSNLEIEPFVRDLERRTSLHFMAGKEGEILNGFVTKLSEGYIISIYGVDKEPDEESSHTFKAVKVTKKLEEAIHG